LGIVIGKNENISNNRSAGFRIPIYKMLVLKNYVVTIPEKSSLT